jgi:hypothetical protein
MSDVGEEPSFTDWGVERRQGGARTDPQLGDGDKDTGDEPVDPGSGCPAATDVTEAEWDQLVFVRLPWRHNLVDRA